MLCTVARVLLRYVSTITSLCREIDCNDTVLNGMIYTMREISIELVSKLIVLIDASSSLSRECV